jgi:hypothetical protein
MSQEKFDDLLRQSFDKDRDIPFDESAWQALEGQLPNSKKYFLPLWALVLLGAGWLLSAALMLFWPQPGTIAVPEKAPSSVAYPAQETNKQYTDTVFVTNTIIVRDTITKYLPPNYRAAYSPPPATLLPYKTIRPLGTSANSSDAQAASTLFDDQVVTSQSGQTPVSGESKSYEPSLARLLPEIPALQYDKPIELLFGSKALQAARKPRARRFYVGLTGGWAAPNYKSLGDRYSLIHGDFVGQEDAMNQASDDTLQLVPVGINQYGIQAGYQLNRFLSLQMEVGRENVSYLNERLLENDFSAYDRAATEYSGSDLLLSQRGMYYEIGLQGRTNKRLSPVARASLRMRSHLLRSFNGFIDGNELALETASSGGGFGLYSLDYGETQRKSFQLEQLRMNAGLAYRFTPDWEIQAAADFYAPLRYDSWIQPRWGISMSLRYRL